MKSKVVWRIAKVGVIHAFRAFPWRPETYSLCGYVRRGDTVMSWRGEPGGLECKECARLAASCEPQHVV